MSEPTTTVIGRSWAFVALICTCVTCAPHANLLYAASVTVSSQKCLKCHPALQQEMASTGAHAPFKKMQCSKCHNPHAANHQGLINKEVGVLCMECHKDDIGEFGGRFGHAPFEEGACLKCHKPHSSENRKLLVATGEKLCFTCHAMEKMLSKRYRHEPVKKGACLTCHGAHTAGYESLMKKSVGKMCGSCHSIGDETGKKAHGNYPVENTRCTSCHNPHASNREALIKTNSHRPFAAGGCTECHNAPGSNDPFGMKGRGVSVCLPCHSSVVDDFKKVASHVVGGAFCANCHSPHASDEEHLKKSKESKICVSCHADTYEYMKNKENKYKHPSINEGKCVECHDPHGSNFRLLYPADEITLCSGCHKRHISFTHPIGSAAIDPRSKADITCTTCHNLMGSRYEFALRLDRRKELCVQCHKGY